MGWSIVYILANSGCAALLFKTSCVCVCVGSGRAVSGGPVLRAHSVVNFYLFLC